MPLIQGHNEVITMIKKDRLLQYIFKCLLEIQNILTKLGD